jgi:hypothetical protein
MARLARTSIRFRDFELDEDRLNELGPEIGSVAARSARDVYGEGVEVDVVLEASSLLVRATVIGALVAGGISKYPDFKEGVSQLVQDAQYYGTAFYNEVLELTGKGEADSVQKNDMTPGRIARLLQRVEKLGELQRQGSKQELQEELRRIAGEVQAIERDLLPAERQLVENELQLAGWASRSNGFLSRRPGHLASRWAIEAISTRNSGRTRSARMQ